ncbi:BrnA antitoxin family protein [Sphingomonas sp. 2378]|uniref:BrnA antitoxin family protein n=1 Tax=Sphingomonas sp. 2378 TaxID=1219748 RepID=UPI00311B2280
MTKPYTQADMDAVSDNPELTDAQLASARPFAEALPAIAAEIQRGRGRQKSPTKIPKHIRLSREVVDFFESTGAGWQSRLDDVLKRYVAEHR